MNRDSQALAQANDVIVKTLELAVAWRARYRMPITPDCPVHPIYTAAHEERINDLIAAKGAERLKTEAETAVDFERLFCLEASDERYAEIMAKVWGEA